MRGVDKPASATDKAWGWTIEMLADTRRRIMKCFAVDGGYCSTHRHKNQANIFIVEKGQLRVFIENEGVWLYPNDSISVPPLVRHSFQALAETLFLEVYIGVHGSPKLTDIERFSESGVKR